MFKKMFDTTFKKVSFLSILFVIFTISSFVFYIIPHVNQSLINEKKYTLHEMSHLLIAILNDLNDRVVSGDMTREQAQELATEITKNYRYGKNGDDYFWVNNIEDGTIFIHPYDTVRGTNLADLTDEKGYNFGKTMLDMAKRNEEGYVEYMWMPKPGTAYEKAVPKLSHVAVFEPWGWVIGTGIYIDDVEKEIAMILMRIIITLLIVLALLIGLLIFIIRIGARIERQKDLIRTEFVSLIQHLPIGMFRIRMDTVAPPLLWNNALIDLLEIPKDAIVRKPNFDLLAYLYDHKDKERIKDILLNNGEISGIELKLHTHTHKTLWVKVYGKTFQNKDVLYFDASIENITERKNAQELLERSYTELKKVDKMKDEIIAITSHELRTPLTIIKGFASILSHQTFGKLNDIQRQYTEKIIGNTNKLLEMITNMLDLEKLDTGKMPSEITDVHINDLITKVCDDFQPKCSLEKRSINFQPDPNDPMISTDPHHLKRVLINLIDNAMKYTMPEIGMIDIFTKIKDSDKIEIHVKDNGIGIAQEDQGDIFKKFKQVGGHTERIAGGSGLGLPIAKKLIIQLGGEIMVSSVPNKGSDFYITLPLKKT